MEENEVITNDSTTENEYIVSDNEISEVTEDVGVYNIEKGEDYYSVDSDAFYSAVSNFNVDSELRCLIVKSKNVTIDYEFVFPIPNEYADDIVLINGNIYNFGTETISLAASHPNDPYLYRILEIPVYGSEEYYRMLSEMSYDSSLNENPQPYRVSVYYRQEDGETVYSQNVGFYYPEFEYTGTPMMSWSYETIFLFIIMVIVMAKTVFRKG